MVTCNHSKGGSRKQKRTMYGSLFYGRYALFSFVEIE